MTSLDPRHATLNACTDTFNDLKRSINEEQLLPQALYTQDRLEGPGEEAKAKNNSVVLASSDYIIFIFMHEFSCLSLVMFQILN